MKLNVAGLSLPTLMTLRTLLFLFPPPMPWQQQSRGGGRIEAPNILGIFVLLKIKERDLPNMF